MHIPLLVKTCEEQKTTRPIMSSAELFDPPPSTRLGKWLIGASHLLLCRNYSAEMEDGVAAHFPPFLSVVGQMDHLWQHIASPRSQLVHGCNDFGKQL